MQTRKWIVSVAGLCVAVLLTTGARGADVTWVGTAGDLQWSNALNWSTSALPGTNDRVVFRGPPSTGYATNDSIRLGASRTISEFRLVSNAPPFSLTGDGVYSLTLTNATSWSCDIVGGGPAGTFALNCDVTLVTNTLWQGFAQEAVNGTLSDGGRGITFTFEKGQNSKMNFNGPVLLSSNVSLDAASFLLGGSLGAMTNADFYMSPVATINNSTIEPQFILDNSSYANGDRFGDNRTIHSYSAGAVKLVGNGTNAVSETVGAIAIETGMLTFENDFYGTNVEIVVKNLTRPPGTGLLVTYVTKAGTASPGTNTKIRIQGESVNTNGIWHPWAIQRGVDSYVRVDANGCLIPLATTDYLTLPASGSLATGIYHATNATFALAASEEVYGFRMDYANTQVFDLGTNDLTIGCGALLFANGGAKTINSSGGRLIFRGNEVIIAGQLGSTATNLAIHAPLASTATGAVYLCMPDINNVNVMTLDGADYIGTYAGLTAALRTFQSTLWLGGPSDRTINGPLCGYFALVQAGTGTLRLNGVDQRTGSGIDVKTGRVVIGNAAALSSTPTVRTGARLDVAAGVVWPSNFTVETNATLGGGGTFGRNGPTLANGVHIAPGDGVGTLTMSNLTLNANTVIEWELGSGTNAAGVDYDLLHVTGSLTLPGPTTNLVVAVADTSKGSTQANGARFTIIDWTGANPLTNQTWSVSNSSPATLDTSTAMVQVNTTDKKIYLSGLKSLGRSGSMVIFR